MESQSTDSCQCFSPDSCSYLLLVYNLGTDQCMGTSPIWSLYLSGTWKLTHSKRILIFPQCISDFNVPLKGKGFTDRAREIFTEVHLSLEQLVS